MLEITSEIILESLAETLETTAFICLEPLADDAPAPEQADLVSLRLRGALNGAVQIAAPHALGVILASNILVVDAGTPEAISAAEDAFKELCNITTGAILARLYSESETPPEMDLPTCSCLSSSQAWSEFASAPGTSVISAEGFPVAIRLLVEIP